MAIRRVFPLIALSGAPGVFADDYVNSADGFVSLYELRAAYHADPEFNKRIEQSFADYDLNGDGLISDDERRAARADSGEAAASAPPGNRSTETGGSGFPGADRETTSGGESLPVEEDAYAAGNSNDGRPDPERQNVAAADQADDEAGRREVQNQAGMSQTELWIAEIDADKSGGASISELIESGGGQPWFTGREFSAADRNGDGDLDAAELDQLVRGIERRQH